MSEQEFFLTFGSQYSNTPHPVWPHAHPDGWVEVTARDYQHARQLVIKKFHVYWAFLYDEKQWNEGEGSAHFYPLGCIGRLSTEGLMPGG